MTFDFQLEYTFADDRQADLDRQLSLLLTTPVQTMPLDREFGLDMSFVDLPSEASKAAYVAELTEKIPLFFPSLPFQMGLPRMLKNRPAGPVLYTRSQAFAFVPTRFPPRPFFLF